jgi:hypothetical protein
MHYTNIRRETRGVLLASLSRFAAPLVAEREVLCRSASFGHAGQHGRSFLRAFGLVS